LKLNPKIGSRFDLRSFFIRKNDQVLINKRKYF
jgi:hypothetical protein